MVYYHIKLSNSSKELCTITTQWGKYEYQRLPMGLCNSPDIFQEKMSELLAGLDTVRVYIDDILHIAKGSLNDHLETLDKILNRLQSVGLKVNFNKSSFATGSLDYLGFHISREGITPIPKKVEAIIAITTPRTRKQLQSFLCMINFYCDMWSQRESLLVPLSALTLSKVPWK